MSLEIFNVRVDNFGLVPELRRSTIAVFRTDVKNDYVASLIEEVRSQVPFGSCPDWSIRLYDLSSFNIPETSDEMPATLPSPLPPERMLHEALSNSQEEIIHFYATLTPAQFLELQPVPPAQPSSWQYFIENSPLVTKSPSKVAKDPRSVQGKGDIRLLNDRPTSEEDVAPAALLYPPFGRFIDIFGGADDVKGIDEVALRSHVEEFATAGREYYSDESARREAMLPILNAIFETHVDGKLWPPILESTVGSLNRVGTDAHSDGESGAADVMTQWKNAITSDAEYEGVAYVTQSHAKASRKYPHVYEANRMLVLLITVQGPHICFLAVLILHHPRVVELTPILGLRHDSANVDALDTLCRAFRAACILRAEIRKDVTMMLDPSPPRPSLLHPEFPSIDKCQSYIAKDELISFKLIQRFESQVDQLVFVAEMGPKTVLVKFTRSYSPDLHSFCHERGHAPQLLGYQQLLGGWFIVVMEFLEDWTDLHSLQISHTQNSAAWRQISTLANAFHEAGFVHGDLRKTNILAPSGWNSTPTPPSLPKLCVVDYDWGGLCGTARYPTPLLNSELSTPRHRLGDLIIRKEDDLRVLARTFGMPPPTVTMEE